MSSPASIRNHPIHPMLVAFPIGLWVFSLVCDIFYHAGSHNELWKEIAFYTLAGGIAGALLAAVPGFIDYLSLTNPRAKQIATTHMVLNLVVVLIFIFNLGVRYNAAPSSDMFAVSLTVVGIALMSVSGWLGGSLVYVHHVGVAREVAPEDDQIKNQRRAA